ncbi:Cyclin-dependent kinases regulatory subunit 1-like 1 [Homarus americanus]|uniref:Cyclin-dependent kinases regulatory subunit n=1 Tax=Homarus americanus TaxID=6706 RepID=A0A8J5K4Y9_HOMAM|nr:Cyclin-dependent kinases regulatory subunit 1-like 1 [Homarus americanus]
MAVISTDNSSPHRHVILPSDVAKLVPKTHLMTETEWRNLGVQQSPGWVHYLVHSPALHGFIASDDFFAVVLQADKTFQCFVWVPAMASKHKSGSSDMPVVK